MILENKLLKFDDILNDQRKIIYNNIEKKYWQQMINQKLSKK